MRGRRIHPFQHVAGWAIGTAFDASDALPLTQGQLRAVPPEQWATIALVLHPSVTRLKLDWAVEPIWRAVMRELNDDSAADAADAAPEANAHHLLIWRDALEARWRILDNDEAQALEQIGGASTFGALCEYLVTQGNAVDAAQTAARYLARWVADGVLAEPPTYAATRRESIRNKSSNAGCDRFAASRREKSSNSRPNQRIDRYAEGIASI